MENGDLRRALLTLEASTAENNLRVAVVTVLLDEQFSLTVANAAELSLLLRAFDVPFLQELQARDAFRRGAMFRAAIYASSEQLRRLSFLPRSI